MPNKPHSDVYAPRSRPLGEIGKPVDPSRPTSFSLQTRPEDLSPSQISYLRTYPGINDAYAKRWRIQPF